MIRFGTAPYLECSSKGFKPFSAFYARLQRYGGKSIEEMYQAAKVLEDGRTGLTWREVKGKSCVNIKEVRIMYAALWDEYIEENPSLEATLQEATGLSDIFGRVGHANQAEELWRIKNKLSESESKQEVPPSNI